MSSVSFCKFAQDIPPMIGDAALYTPAVPQPSVTAPAPTPALSNDQITEDILTVVDKLSDKFNETFQNVTDPEVYARINNTLQQMDPGDLARIGAMLGGGTVGFRRALAGDSPAEVLRGVTVGAALGAAGGYALPKILDSLVGAKTASLVKEGAWNPLPWIRSWGGWALSGVARRFPWTKTYRAALAEKDMALADQGVKKLLGLWRTTNPSQTRLTLEGAASQAIRETLAASRKGSSTRWLAPFAAGTVTGMVTNEYGGKVIPRRIIPGFGSRGGSSSGDSWYSFNISPEDVNFMLGGFGVGSVLGLLYSSFKKRKDTEEEPGVVMPTLLGGGLGILGGLLAGRGLKAFGLRS